MPWFNFPLHPLNTCKQVPFSNYVYALRPAAYTVVNTCALIVSALRFTNNGASRKQKNTDMLNNPAMDKGKNFMTGIAIGVATQAFLWMILPPQIKLVTLVSLIAVMVLNYGFDVYAKRKKGNYEVLDAAAGTIGGVIGMTLILLLQFGI